MVSLLGHFLEERIALIEMTSQKNTSEQDSRSSSSPSKPLPADHSSRPSKKQCYNDIRADKAEARESVPEEEKSALLELVENMHELESSSSAMMLELKPSGRVSILPAPRLCNGMIINPEQWQEKLTYAAMYLPQTLVDIYRDERLGYLLQMFSKTCCDAELHGQLNCTSCRALFTNEQKKNMTKKLRKMHKRYQEVLADMSKSDEDLTDEDFHRLHNFCCINDKVMTAAGKAIKSKVAARLKRIKPPKLSGALHLVVHPEGSPDTAAAAGPTPAVVLPEDVVQLASC